MTRVLYNESGYCCPFTGKVCVIENCETSVKVEHTKDNVDRACSFADMAVSLDLIRQDIEKIKNHLEG